MIVTTGNYLISDKQLSRAEAWVTEINNLDVKGDSQVKIIEATCIKTIVKCKALKSNRR